MTELIWDGKYKDGKKQGPVRIALPFQNIETVNESVQERQRSLELFSAGRGTEWRNRLIWGDKKYVLPSLLPEFSGKVNLIYIDPPFDTGADFSYSATIPSDIEEVEGPSFTKEPSILEQKAYRDTWGSGLNSYLHWFYEAAALLRELLTDDGSLYVHIGSNVSHYVKGILDEVLGADRYVNEIIWKRAHAHSDTKQGRKAYGNISDTIFYYTASDRYTFNTQFTPYSQEYIDKYFRYRDPDGRRYWLDNLTGPGGGAKGNPYYEVLGVSRYWRFSKEKMQKLVSQGRVVQSNPGNVPQYKRYLDEMPGIPLQNIWTDIPPINMMAKERVGYPTQKPETLLERIVRCSSNEGDLILDCFAGSGTTCSRG